MVCRVLPQTLVSRIKLFRYSTQTPKSMAVHDRVFAIHILTRITYIGRVDFIGIYDAVLSCDSSYF